MKRSGESVFQINVTLHSDILKCAFVLGYAHPVVALLKFTSQIYSLILSTIHVGEREYLCMKYGLV
jgi:hypothetical protein